MDRRELADALAESLLGDALDPDELDRIAGQGSVREAAGGEVLREEGERGDTLMVVLDGRVEVVKGDKHGHRHVLVTLERGAILGELSLLSGTPATATLRAAGPGRLFELDRDHFESLLSAGDPAANRLLLAIARELALRLKRMNDAALAVCEEYEDELAKAGHERTDARVSHLSAFRDQLAHLSF